MSEEILVSIVCLTYNHEMFITDALEGFVNQHTSFRYEVLVHDDASTDKTSAIIREYEKKYPDIIKPIYQTDNQFNRCRIFPTYVLPKVQGKYIALCDGDDYWIDENKLQLQVDYMETHPECTMTMHNAWRIQWDTGEKKLLNTFPESGYYGQLEHILSGLGTDFPACASMIFRSDIMKKIPAFFLEPKAIDYSIRQYCASMGKIYYFSNVMSVYRAATPQSFMRKTAGSLSFYCQYTLEMIRFFEAFNAYTNYEFNEVLERKIASDYYGYCCSVQEEEGMEYAKNLDLSILQRYYHYLSMNYVSDEVKAISKETERLYIYGTSRIAAICGEQLDTQNIKFEGYVVSDGQLRSSTFQGKKVYYLSELQTEKNAIGFILGVQPVNAMVIKSVLENGGYTKYCEPYPI